MLLGAITSAAGRVNLIPESGYGCRSKVPEKPQGNRVQCSSVDLAFGGSRDNAVITTEGK